MYYMPRERWNKKEIQFVVDNVRYIIVTGLSLDTYLILVGSEIWARHEHGTDDTSLGVDCTKMDSLAVNIGEILVEQ